MRTFRRPAWGWAWSAGGGVRRWARSSPYGALQVFLAGTVLGLGLWDWRGTLCRLRGLARRRGARRTVARLLAWNSGRLAWGALGLLAVVGGIVAAAGLFVAGETLVALLALLLGVALGLLATADGPAEVARRALLAAGLGILLAVEIVYLRDFLDGGDWRRMNTLFKFYIQAWVLLAVALGSALPAAWERLTRRPNFAGRAWAAIAALLVGAGLSYAGWAVPQRAAERFPGERPGAGTLDGTAFMATGVYHWPDVAHEVALRYDLEAIRWLWENVTGTPVLAQADLGYYREGGLLPASFTGLPTIVGMHEAEQRPWEQVAARQSDVARLYNTVDVGELHLLLARYDVRYVYVGQLERTVYRPEGLTKFEALAASGALERVYQNERVTIYHIPAGAPPAG